MSFNFNDQCDVKHLEAVQRSLDQCCDANDKAGMRKWVLYLGILKRKCGIVERSCQGCAPETKRVNPCPNCESKPLKTMIGLEEFELVKNASGEIIGMKSHEETPEPVPKIPDAEPIHMIMLRANDKNMEEQRKKERTIDPNQLQISKKITRSLRD